MNEQLQQALAEMLNKTAAGIDAGSSFLMAEIPDVIQQLLMWKMVSSILAFSVMTAAFLYSLHKLKPWAAAMVEYNKGSSLYYSHSGELEAQGRKLMAEQAGKMPFAIGWLFVSIIAGMTFFFEGIQSAGVALQIAIAPKIYLIEYAASLAK